MLATYDTIVRKKRMHHIVKSAGNMVTPKNGAVVVEIIGMKIKTFKVTQIAIIGKIGITENQKSAIIVISRGTGKPIVGKE